MGSPYSSFKLLSFIHFFPMNTKLYLKIYLIKENILFKELLGKVFFDTSEYFNTKVYFFSTVKRKSCIFIQVIFYTSCSLILLKLYITLMLETNFVMFLFSRHF